MSLFVNLLNLKARLLALLATFVLVAWVLPSLALAQRANLATIPFVFLVETDAHKSEVVSPQPGARNDVGAVCERLKALGVPEGRIEERGSRADKASRHPDNSNIEEGFKAFADSLTEEDFALVYPIGRGTENKDTKVSYYMPLDADPDDFGKSVASEFGGSHSAGDRATLTVNGAEFAFRYCPAGSFQMGSSSGEGGRDSDETQHKVTLTKGFWLMETELTQKQWEALMNDNPSNFKGDELPVEQISWNDCQKLIEKLNANSSKLSGWKFELPTEAQWEYACRAGTETPFFWGSSLNGDKANCNGNYPYGTSIKGKYLEKTAPVKSYDSNKWGFYDMCGNVWEWCKDWYGDYPSGEATDPEGPNAGSDRVFRGGSWYFYAVFCRSAKRQGSIADGRYLNLGARLALVSTSN